MSEADWQIVFTVAVLLVSGLAFLAWHAPTLFARYYSIVGGACVGAFVVSLSFFAGAQIALASVMDDLPVGLRPKLTAAQQQFGLSPGLGWLLAFLGISLVGLARVAIYRAEQQRRAEGKGDKGTS